MVEHALPEVVLAAEAVLAGEAARAAHMEGMTAAQEEEGITWIANTMAAAEHEFAHMCACACLFGLIQAAVLCC